MKITKEAVESLQCTICGSVSSLKRTNNFGTHECTTCGKKYHTTTIKKMICAVLASKLFHEVKSSQVPWVDLNKLPSYYFDDADYLVQNPYVDINRSTSLTSIFKN